ncbi:MAG TPA: cyclic nucleotide-binding domain-containing protein [Kofleriaceae bacterium]|nr:cyclic nucleotide-binding domain-containing protein [Kofleriaceae bacterium]
MSTKRPIRDLERDLKKEPGNLALRLQLAAAYREGLRSLEALDLYRSVARAYAEQGRHGQAAIVCRSALEIAPEDSELFGMLMHLERASTTPPPFGPGTSTRPPTLPPPVATAGTPPPAAPPPGVPTPITGQPASGPVSRTRVLPAEVSVRELGSVASTVKHVPPPPPAGEPARPARPAGPGGPPIGALPPPRRNTPTGRVSSLDVPTPLPDPLPLHETTGRDSLIEMAELIGRPTPTPQPTLRSSARPHTDDDDSETVIPLTQVRTPAPTPPVAPAAPAPRPAAPRTGAPTSPPPSVLTPPAPPRPRPGPPTAPPPPAAPPSSGPAMRPALPRITQTRPPPTRLPASRPPPPRAPSARPGTTGDEPMTQIRTEVSPRPSEGDFASDMQTRRRPKLTPGDLALVDLDRLDQPAELGAPMRDPGPPDEPDAPHAPHDAGDPDDAGDITGDAEPGPTTARMPPLPDDEDEPTQPPGLPAGLAPSIEVTPPLEPQARDTTTDIRAGLGGSASGDAPGDTRTDTNVRRDRTSTEAPPPDEITSGTFDRSFDATLSALGPDGAALEGPLGVFSMLPPEAAVELAHRAVVRRYAAGEIIIREGEPGDACYVIVHGEVAIHKRAPEGGNVVELARLSDGSLFGEFALLADRRRHATVVATTDCEIYEIPRVLLRELAAIFPEVGPALETFYRERLLSNLLFTTPLFTLVPDDQRPALLARFHPLHADSGQALVRQGERAGGLYLIVLGAVEVVRRVGDRRAVVLATLGEGSYFGEMSLLSGEMASASVVAAGPCELAVLPPRDFYEIVSANPELWAAMRAEADARRLANAQILAGHTGVV